MPGSNTRRNRFDVMRFTGRTADPASPNDGEIWTRTDGVTNISARQLGSTANLAPRTSLIERYQCTLSNNAGLTLSMIGIFPTYRMTAAATSVLYWNRIGSAFYTGGNCVFKACFVNNSSQAGVKDAVFQLQSTIQANPVPTTAETTYSNVVRSWPSGAAVRTVQIVTLGTITDYSAGGQVSGSITRLGADAGDTVTGDIGVIAAWIEVQ